jgi:lambda family phage portal protein
MERASLIDRTIEAVAPSWALQRAEGRTRLALLETLDQRQAGATALMDGDGGGATPGASNPARRWWNPFPRDARSDTLPRLPNDRAASRELSATNPIAAGAINTNIDRVVGSGLALVSQPNAVLGWSADQVAAWKQKVQAEFSLWADSTNCDYADTNTFYELQAIVLRSTLESGDCFTNMPSVPRTRMQPYGLRLQVIEADRVGNPDGKADTANMAGGVRFGSTGAPDAYHVYKGHPGAGYVARAKHFEGDWIDRLGPSGRKRILHHFRKRRPEQPRGVPYLAPIVDIIKQLGRYTEAEITAAVITAYLTVFIEAPGGNTSPIFTGEPKAGDTTGEVGLGMGAVVGLAPGEKATAVNPGRPNPNFGPFIENVITQIGMALGLPRELLIKQFNSSYSASKAALLDAWIYIRNVRVWLAGSFCQPVFETWLSESVAIGRVSAPGFFADPLLRWAYTRAAWPGDSMGSINPKDEVAAYTAAIDARLMTRERAEWELFSSDFNETLAQKEAEQLALAKRQLLPVPKAGAAAAPANNAPNQQDNTP